MKTAAVLAVIALWSANPASAKPSRPCLSGMRQALLTGGFSGPLSCSRKNATFVRVGQTAGGKYTVYDYHYRFIAARVMHGGHRVLFFDRGKYVGQYNLSTPPDVNVTINKMHLMLKVQDTGEQVRVNLASKPPGKILINGEVADFFR